MKIAVCDDNESQLDMMVYRLEEYFSVRGEPVRIDDYTSGKSLLEKLVKYKYDVFILGVAMKELNGIQTTNEIKKIDDEAMIIFNTSLENIEESEYDLSNYHVMKKSMSRVEYLNNIDTIYRKYKLNTNDTNRIQSKILFTEKPTFQKRGGFIKRIT
jgi:DNA-binding NtrC family response regulator